jgi:hypothetical protein
MATDDDLVQRWSQQARQWRRQLKDQMPYVRRRQFDRALQRFDHLADVLAAGVRRPSEAAWRWQREPVAPLNAVVCLLAAYQRGSTLAPALVWLATQYLALGHRVVLVLNTDEVARPLQIDDAFAARFAGILVRQNTGYDFGAWAHAHALLRDRLDPRKLVLANDSVVGPLDETAFDHLWDRIESSTADLVGLTESLRPLRHLQSYCLVFGREAWLGGHVSRFLDDVLAFDDKGLVIAIYESRLTRRLQHAGLRCEAVYPSLSRDPVAFNDTIDRWRELLDQGFPFVKASVLREEPDAVLAHAAVQAAPAPVREILADVSRSRR